MTAAEEFQRDGETVYVSDSLMKRLERDGVDVARRFLIERDGSDAIRISGTSFPYLRGELAGLARSVWYITGEDIGEVERRWIDEAKKNFAVPEASRT